MKLEQFRFSRDDSIGEVHLPLCQVIMILRTTMIFMIILIILMAIMIILMTATMPLILTIMIMMRMVLMIPQKATWGPWDKLILAPGQKGAFDLEEWLYCICIVWPLYLYFICASVFVLLLYCSFYLGVLEKESVDSKVLVCEICQNQKGSF